MSLCTKLATRLKVQINCPLRKFFSKTSVAATEIEDKQECYTLQVLNVYLEHLGFVFPDEDWTVVSTKLTSDAWVTFDYGEVDRAVKVEVKSEVKREVRELKREVKSTVKSEVKSELASALSPPAVGADVFSANLIRNLNRKIAEQTDTINRLRKKHAVLRTTIVRQKQKWAAVKSQHRRGKTKSHQMNITQESVNKNPSFRIMVGRH